MSEAGKNRLAVKVAQIPVEGLTINEDLPREWLTNIPEFAADADTRLEGMIHARGKLWREGENLRLHGAVQATLTTICTRCGEPLKYPLAGEFDAVLIKGPAPGEEVDDLTPEDEVRNYYDGIEADLTPLYQEEIALQLPIQPLCREDCKGLCPSCGANWNTEKCGCEKNEGDPRLAVFRNLKIDK